MPLPTTNLFNRFTAKAGTTVISNGLDAWQDQDGDGDSLTAAAATNRPAMNSEQLDGVDVPVFDGSDDFLSLASFTTEINDTNSDIIVMAAVLKINGSQSFGFVWDGGSGINDNTLYVSDDPDELNAREATNISSVSYTPNQWMRVIVKYIGDQVAGWDGQEIYINGTLVSTSNTAGITGVTGLTLGQRQDGFGNGEFSLAELVRYQGDVDAADLDQYLGEEWGLITGSDTTSPTLPTNTFLTSSISGKDILDISYQKSTGDDTDPTGSLVYKLWRADKGTDISTVELINASSSLVVSGSDVSTLQDSGSVQTTTFYEYNVTVEDTSGNQAAYSQSQAVTTIGGKVTLSSVGEQSSSIAIFDMSNVGFDLSSLGAPYEIAQSDAQGDWYMTSSYNPSGSYLAGAFHFETNLTGSATSGSINSLTDTNLSMSNNEYAGQMIELTAGSGSDDKYRIATNDVDTFVITGSFETIPNDTTEYRVGDIYSSPFELFPRIS